MQKSHEDGATEAETYIDLNLVNHPRTKATSLLVQAGGKVVDALSFVRASISGCNILEAQDATTVTFA